MAGIHDYDLANWFFDAQPTAVRASSVDSPAGRSPDLLWAMLEYPGARLAVVETAWVLPDAAGLWLEAEVEVIGSAGVAHLHFPGDALSLYLPSGHERPDTTAVVDALGQPVGTLVDELSYFARCVATGQAPSRVRPRRRHRRAANGPRRRPGRGHGLVRRPRAVGTSPLPRCVERKRSQRPIGSTQRGGGGPFAPGSAIRDTTVTRSQYREEYS